MYKAVFIDGASLWHMLDNLQARRIDFKFFRKFLAEKVGSCVLRGKPFITVSPTTNDRFLHALGMNFEVLRASSDDSQDDQRIIERIRAINPKTHKEIVIVSNDRDFAPALLKQTDQGVAVYWVGTRVVNGDGRSGISPELEALFHAGRFTFVEMGNVVKELTLDTGFHRRVGMVRDGVVTITLMLPEESAAVDKLFTAIGKLAQEFPGLRYDVKNFQD